jgi:pyridoxal phosphate enzyme (YggS family)
MGIYENYCEIRDKADKAARAAGRDPESVKIIAVSKTFPVSDINEAIRHGITLFGENRVQEAKEKIPMLEKPADFHLIGHLQSNKAKEAVKLFSLIHSLDKAETAGRIDREAAAIEKVQEVLIQVNTSGESTKSGVDPAGVFDLFEHISGLQNIRPSGLMTIGPMTDDKTSIRKSFADLALLLRQVNGRFGLSMTELSMGMSGDFELAIAEGATLVRVGSAIFGKRSYQA